MLLVSRKLPDDTIALADVGSFKENASGRECDMVTLKFSCILRPLRHLVVSPHGLPFLPSRSGDDTTETVHVRVHRSLSAECFGEVAKNVAHVLGMLFVELLDGASKVLQKVLRV